MGHACFRYPDASQHTSLVADLGGTVLHGVDARNLAATKALKGRRFTKVVFNFPHVGERCVEGAMGHGNLHRHDRSVAALCQLCGTVLRVRFVLLMLPMSQGCDPGEVMSDGPLW